MSYRAKREGNYGNTRKLQRVHARRSPRAKQIDESLRAPLAKTSEQWVAQPNRYDIPDVDTPKQGNTASYRMSEAYFWKKVKNLDRLINKDDIEEKNPANKRMVEQILKTLDKNKIPYYYGGEDTGIQVLINDLERAEKLTDRLNIALQKTL